MYSPGSLNVTVVDALPVYGSSTFPPLSVSNFGFAVPNVTTPGPRYFDRVTFTGGGAFRMGAFVPVLYFASSSTRRSSGIGIPTAAVRANGLDGPATGP